MKQCIIFLGLALLMGCGGPKLLVTNPDRIPAVSDSTLVDVSTVKEAIGIRDSELALSSQSAINKSIAFSSESAIAYLMHFLASDELQGRDTGSGGIEKAAQFITSIFEKNSIAPYFSTYLDTLANYEKPAFNVVGFLEGTDAKLKQEFVIIGAHYDHIGLLTPVGGDAIANGANDNATGTSAVLELARYFGAEKTNKRSLIFALFSAEEKGLLGSEHLAQKLKRQNLNLYTMLNFEMLGVPLNNKPYAMYVTGYELSNLAEISNRYAGEALVGFLPTAKEYSLFKRSDNYPFHQVFNVPSQTFSTFDFTNFDHYHQVGDENELMNFDHMAKLVNKTIPVLEGIINAPVQEIRYK
ncbi:M28 family peptidase [Arenibacter sp. GZD96]|uniref:M28 family metallopeptidase n=1 Tax=Aurantibrevibacter litoralis TaxID=3106030 RepID=UPI002AFFA512|nr:M28 family peptidase [Arenibacter sp. GZD-96]MEA1785939.1 M28 family peptidase [Arenibacter sp. GZD-96]